MQSFPKMVRGKMGEAIFFAQYGETHPDAKPFKYVGTAVFEITEKFSKNAYRSVYAANIGDKLYVLHVFQKKSPTGIKTAKKDVDLIKQRYKFAKSFEKGN